MKRKPSSYYAKEEIGGSVERGAGGGGSWGPSSSLRGSEWSKGPKPTEMPKSKMELRGEQRKAQPSTSKPRENWEEWKARNKIKGFEKGGFVSGFSEGLGRGLDASKGKDKKRKSKQTEEIFPESPGTGLYRKGGMVSGDYAKKC